MEEFLYCLELFYMYLSNWGLASGFLRDWCYFTNEEPDDDEELVDDELKEDFEEDKCFLFR